MPIKGISDIRRLPRKGKIKLGEIVESNGKTYPKQLPFLRVQEEIKAVYGDKPTSIDVMFTSENVEDFFPQYYKLYTSNNLLKCKGDGIKASMMVNGQTVEKECTPGNPVCKGCKPVAILRMFLPNVPGFGIWEVSTSSWNSIVNLNSCLDTIRVMASGRISFIRLKLLYKKHLGSYFDVKKNQQCKTETYVLSLEIDETIEEFYKRYKAPSLDENPKLLAMEETKDQFALMNKNKKRPAAELDQEVYIDGELIELDPEGKPLTADNKSVVDELICECGLIVSKAEKKYSNSKFNKTLCRKCQKIQVKR